MSSTAKSAKLAANKIDYRLQKQDLCEALARLRDPSEIDDFLTDLCTPAELKALAGRWQVAQFLDDGEHSYRDIHQITGMSTTTIGRVARFLFDENYRGYRRSLDRLKRVRK